MFGNVSELFEVFECVLTVDNGTDIVRQGFQAPRAIIEQEFMSIMQQAHQDNSPVKVSISRIVPIYDEMRDEWIEREHYIEYKNKVSVDADNDE